MPLAETLDRPEPPTYPTEDNPLCPWAQGEDAEGYVRVQKEKKRFTEGMSCVRNDSGGIICAHF